MAINPLDVIGNQVKSAARNQVRTAQAEFRRETSIVGYANARIGAAAKKLDQARKKPANARRTKAGVYVQEHPAILAPDGYVRRSPVQPLRVAPDYYKRLGPPDHRRGDRGGDTCRHCSAVDTIFTVIIPQRASAQAG